MEDYRWYPLVILENHDAAKSLLKIYLAVVKWNLLKCETEIGQFDEKSLDLEYQGVK